MAEIVRVQLSCPSPGAFEVRVLDSPAGEPHHALDPPFDAPTAGGVAKILEKADPSRLAEDERSGLRALGILRDGALLEPEARNRLIGQRLYSALFPSSDQPNANVRGALQSAVDQAIRNSGQVSLQLRFDSDAVDLAALPWELICDPNGQHLAATGQVHLTRYITFGQAVAPLPVSDRLEVLTVTPRPLVGVTNLGPDDERKAILAAFGELASSHRLHVEACEPPTYFELCHRVNARPYHIIHFDGHGGFLARCPSCGRLQRTEPPRCVTPGCPRFGQALEARDGCLAFEDGSAARAADLVAAEELAATLAGRGVLLFVASACQSAMVGGASVFASVGPRLILAGLPASVAMQFSLETGPATHFTAEFYAALARGDSIAAAASAGRGILFRDGGWYVPAVYLRSRDGEGFLFRYHSWAYMPQPAGARPDFAAMRPRDAAPYKFLSPYEITDKGVFFGRDGDTARLLEEVLGRPLVVLSGLPGVGKTSLVNAGLTPELMARDYLVLTIREYGGGDPIEMLRETISASAALDIESVSARDLPALLGSVMQATGRRLAVVFDDFDKYLRDAAPNRRAGFSRQLAACIATLDRTRYCLVLVVRDDFVGRLPALLPDLPDILHGLVPLEPFTPEQARQALEGPLARHEPPMRFDAVFLRDTLLKELCAGQEKVVSPTYLQIVGRELYNAAGQAGVQTIGPDLYPKEGAQVILARYLDETLSRLQPSEQRDLARTLLKAMASQAGERVFVPTSRLAQLAGAELSDVQAALDALLKEGLLEPRPMPDGAVAYSLGHHMLAAEVQGRSDPEEARDRCAQAALDRDWEAWYEQWYVTRRQGPTTADVIGLLVPADHLREIRARRPGVAVGAPQLCLLLQSAVRQRCDMDYWARELAGSRAARELAESKAARELAGSTAARELAESKAARELKESEAALDLVRQIHDGPAANAPRDARQTVELGAEALGIGRADIGQGGLARAAVAYGSSTRRDGAVRHAAALALAALAEEALGLNAVEEALATLHESAPKGWRRTQALAQMKAAGFKLPESAKGGRRSVALWAFGLALWEQFWPIVTEAAAAGLGAALGLALCLLISTLLLSSGDPGQVMGYAFRGFFLQPMGLVLGFMAVAAARVVSLAVGRGDVRRQVLGRVIGFALGFMLVLVFVWLPIVVYVDLIFSGGTQPIADYFLTYVVGGAIWGLGIVIGRELGTRSPARRRLGWAILGGGLGGAAACLLIMGLATAKSQIPALDGLEMTVPLVEESEFDLVRWVEAFLAGFGIGGGLSGGWELGRRLWSRLQPGG